jgi:phage terminase small subunit
MSLEASPIPLPKDPRHQRFADLVIEGIPAAQAYKEAGFKSKTAQSRATAASRLLKRKDVSAYIRAIQAEAAKGCVASVQYKRELLFEIMDTPLMAIDPDDPARKHGRLIRKFKRQSDEIRETYEIEKHCPLKAIEIDNKLSGDDPETNSLRDLADAIGRLAPESGLPTGKM